MNNFYLLYHAFLDISSQVGEQAETHPIAQQDVENLDMPVITQQLAEQLHSDVFGFLGAIIWF